METADFLSKYVEAVSGVIRGKEHVIRLLVCCLVAGGHALLEDVPGTGKTSIAKALATAVKAKMSRVQFTPDLLPSELTGVSVFEQSQNKFRFHPGPIFTNILLADELNRASPKTQAALLEAMAESQVSVEGRSMPLGEVFFVIATQNPTDSLGTYPLPDSQLDRFMVKTSVGGVDRFTMLEILAQEPDVNDRVPAMCTTEELLNARKEIQGVHVEPVILDYVARLLEAVASSDLVDLGISVRGALALVALSRAWAMMHSRSFVIPDDVKDLAPHVFTHRIIMSRKALEAGISAQAVISQILVSVPVPGGRS